jgi:hypothetical protein
MSSQNSQRENDKKKELKEDSVSRGVPLEQDEEKTESNPPVKIFTETTAVDSKEAGYADGP